MNRGAAIASRVGTGEQIFLDGKMFEAVPAFHYLDNTPLYQFGRTERVDTVTLEFDTALGNVATLGAQQGGNRLQRGGLSRTVSPEQGDDALLGNFERYAFQHQDDMIVNDFDVINRQQDFVVG